MIFGQVFDAYTETGLVASGYWRCYRTTTGSYGSSLEGSAFRDPVDGQNLTSDRWAASFSYILSVITTKAQRGFNKNGLQRAKGTFPALSSDMAAKICCLGPSVLIPSSLRSPSVNVRNASISTWMKISKKKSL